MLMPPSDPVCAASLWPSIPQAMHGSFRIQASPREVVDFPPEIVSQRWWFDVRNIRWWPHAAGGHEIRERVVEALFDINLRFIVS